jgi:transcriptional regulator with XRE-family HTH domain
MVISLEKYRRTRKVALSIQFGEWLRVFRENKGLTQEQLASRVGYNRTVISRWETGAMDIRPHEVAEVALSLESPELAEHYCLRCPVCDAFTKISKGPVPA